jgi:hypothetical protein
LILFVCGTLFLVSCCCGVGVVSWGFQESFKRLLRLKQADDGPGKGGSGPRTPHAFADEITRDASASQKYAGKSLVIEGEVGRVERVGKEQKLGLVLFANPPHALEFAMKPSDQAKAVRLALGQRVKVTAIFRGTRDNRFLMFDTAGVTESEPAKVLEISSQKLVESLVNGGPEEADRFRGVVLISGPIVEFKDAAPGETVVKMRGSGKVSLCLVFDRDGAKEAARLEKAKGATIRIVDGVDFDRVEQRVVVHRPLVVEAK